MVITCKMLAFTRRPRASTNVTNAIKTIDKAYDIMEAHDHYVLSLNELNFQQLARSGAMMSIRP